MKENKKEETKIDKLTGEPGAYDVSLVAMGQEPSNGMESEFEDNEKMFMKKLGFGKDGDSEDDEKQQMCSSIEEAYAQLFESLAVISRGKH